MRRAQISEGRSARPRADVGQVQAWLDEAAAHRVEGRYDEAVALYQRVEQAWPGEVNAGYFLALIDLVRGHPAPALTRLTKLVRQMPGSFEAWQALSHVRRELGQWEGSIEASKRALELQPTNVQEKVALATALEVAGEIDQAIAVLRDIASGPGRAAALNWIALMRPATIGSIELTEIAATADEQNADELRAAASYALAHVLEHQGLYDEAFAAFASANAITRSILSGNAPPLERGHFAPKVRALTPAAAERLDIEEVNFMLAVFTREFLAGREGCGHDSAAPIFIVGMPRSGSTLIEQILSSHRKVQGMGETTALTDAVGDAFPLKILGEEKPRHFQQLANKFLTEMRQRGWNGAPRFVDKTLGNYIFVGLIHLMFPKAVILHSVRDPVDTCLANFRVRFATANEASYDLGDIGRQYVRYRQVMDHWAEVLPGRVIDVEHEALVADPEARIRWLVTEACGLAWDEACLSFHKTKRPVRTASVAQVRQPIFTTSVRRWRRYQKHLGPLFEALGPYAPKDV